MEQPNDGRGPGFRRVDQARMGALISWHEFDDFLRDELLAILDRVAALSSRGAIIEKSHPGGQMSLAALQTNLTGVPQPGPWRYTWVESRKQQIGYYHEKIKQKDMSIVWDHDFSQEVPANNVTIYSTDYDTRISVLKSQDDCFFAYCAYIGTPRRPEMYYCEGLDGLLGLIGHVLSRPAKKEKKKKAGKASALNESGGHPWRRLDEGAMAREMRGVEADTFSEADVLEVFRLLEGTGKTAKVTEYHGQVGRLGLADFGSEAVVLRKTIFSPDGWKTLTNHPGDAFPMVRVPAARLGIDHIHPLLPHAPMEVCKSSDDYFYAKAGPYRKEEYFVCDGIDGLLSLVGHYLEARRVR